MQKRTRKDPLGRFMAKVHDNYQGLRHPLSDLTGCWIWIGGVTKAGYGNFCIERDGHGGHQTQKLAHRFAYETLIGPIPEGMQLDHLCNNKRCVNPDHLKPVTARENTLRADTVTGRNARKTHCKRGHPLRGDNLRIMPDGERDCKECARMWQRTYRKRKQKQSPDA